ncbi:MAG TPA: hypothetical protein VMF65_19880 [Acidimicrobiales bacterium]|nr:hypothetical protein [Acidimicrobiales bacterium]
MAAVTFWAWLDRHLWFFGDEWDFLVRRGLSYPPGSNRSIWFPHNEHWSTLPILMWRGLYSIFHLSSYWPYLVPLFLAQAIVMHLAWRMCRRNGVDAWIATAAVALLGFLGAGAEDLASAFQVTFVASVLFGYVAFDLLDRPARPDRPASPDRTASLDRTGSLDRTASLDRSGGLERTAPLGRSPRDGQVARRRDILASVALLAGLMCSTIGDAFVVGAAVLLWARGPRKRAAAVLALPVGSYVIWFGFIGRLGLTTPADHLSLAKVTSLPQYVWFGLSSALGQTFNLEAAGAALLVGLAAWVIWHSQSLWRENPALLGLFVAAVAFYVVVGLGRDTTSGATAVISRYVYVGLAILLPVMAKALSSVSPWPAARCAVVALLGITVLGNVGQAQAWVSNQVAIEDSLKPELVATARLLLSGVPDVSGPGATPIALYPDLPAASISRLARSGQLPKTSVTAAELVNARALLAVGTSVRSKTELTAGTLFPGRFAFAGAARSTTSRRANGCLDFAPETVSPPMEVRLRLPAGEPGASVRVISSPASPGLTNHLAALLVPPSGPAATSAVQLTVPPDGTGYLSDDDPGAQLLLLWDIGTPLELCGLASG